MFPSFCRTWCMIHTVEEEMVTEEEKEEEHVIIVEMEVEEGIQVVEREEENQEEVVVVEVEEKVEEEIAILGEQDGEGLAKNKELIDSKISEWGKVLGDATFCFMSFR